MRVTRRYADQSLQAGTTVDLPAEHLNYLTRVLRLRKGDAITLFNGRDGIDYTGQLTRITKTSATVRVDSAGQPEIPSQLDIHLAIGISRGERMDFAIQKSVELGVQHIHPLFAGRSVVKLSGERLAKKLHHWEGVITAACEQSGRRWIPRLHEPQALMSWLASRPEPSLLLDHRNPTQLNTLNPPADQIAVLVGPEGGWTSDERELALRQGCIGISLGPRVMRTETAPLASIAAIQTLWGDFCE
ncbi:MAG: 16S rRNA (uracil(1498)-N(3))-methyltransferase [bacterium]